MTVMTLEWRLALAVALLAMQGAPSLALSGGSPHPARLQGRRQAAPSPFTQQERDAMCRPIHDYSEAEVASWLTGHGYNASAFAGVNGEGLMHWAEQDGGFAFTMLGVPFTKVPRLTNLIKAARQPPHLHLPPSMDPCSAFYLTRGGGGTDLYVTPLIETVLELDQEKYTFTAIFQLLFMWHDDRVQYIPVGSIAELDKCQRMCSAIPGHAETCPSDANCAPQSDGAPADKCCDDLWTPIRHIDYQGAVFPNAVEMDILSTQGPNFLIQGVQLLPPQQDITAAFVTLTQRIKGTFNIPLSFRDYPLDEQSLDIYLAFPDANQFIKIVSADGIYSMGGDWLPRAEKDKFLENGYEEISGWTIKEDVKFLTFVPGNEYKLWLLPGMEPKFEAQSNAILTVMEGFGLSDSTIPEFFASALQGTFENFGIIRLTLKRNPQYYEQNIVIPVVLLNCLNFLALMLGPEAIEARLASCATVILALMTFQIVVTDQLPRAGYPMGAATFLIVSNIYMISTGIESVLIYYLHNNNVSPLCSRGAHPARLRLELRMCDALFVLVYIGSYLPLLTDLARPTAPEAFIIPFALLGVLCVFTIFALFKQWRLVRSAPEPPPAPGGAGGEEKPAPGSDLL